MLLHEFINNALGSSIKAIHTYLVAPNPRIIIEYSDCSISSHKYGEVPNLFNKAKPQTDMALSDVLKEKILKDSGGILSIDESGTKYILGDIEKLKSLYNQTEVQQDTLTGDEEKMLAAPTTPLPWYKLEKNFDAIADSALKMLNENPTSRIFSLGQSPAWIVKAAEHISNLSHKNQKFGYIPFSGNFYDVIDEGERNLEFMPREFKPTSTQEESYHKLLDHLELGPKTIMKNYQHHHTKTSIMDFINTGGGLVSFLSILFSWAKQEGILADEIKSALEIVLLVTSEKEAKNSLKFDEVSIVCRKQVIEEIWGLANGVDSGAYSDRLVPRHPYEDWDNSPQNISENSDFIKELTDKVDAAIERRLSIHPLATSETEAYNDSTLNTIDYKAGANDDEINVVGDAFLQQ